MQQIKKMSRWGKIKLGLKIIIVLTIFFDLIIIVVPISTAIGITMYLLSQLIERYFPDSS